MVDMKKETEIKKRKKDLKKVELFHCGRVLVFLTLCVKLQKSLGHARFKYDLRALVTAWGKGLDVLRHTTATEKDGDRGRLKKTRKKNWMIRVLDKKSESAGKGKKKREKKVERER